MDELEIKGKKYISSKRASELTGYAKDYIGQLARGGKLPGTRVGRAWYVEEEALTKLSGPENKTFLLESVQSLEKQPALYSLNDLRNHKASPSVFSTWGSISYSNDDRPLLPSIGIVENDQPEESRIDNQNIVIPVRRDIKKSVTYVTNIETRKAPTSSVGQSFPVALVALFLLLALIIPVSGWFVGSDWKFSDSSTSFAAAFAGLEGVRLLQDYFMLLINSFWNFFQIGVDFLTHILNLVYPR